MYFMNRDILLNLFLILFVKVFADDHYCSSTSGGVIIQGETEGYIITRKEGQPHYSNNLLCNWIIQAKPNERILLTVEYSDLQWTQSLSLCLGYDHVDVRDKNGTLAAWCGYEFPREITSKDSWLKIIFQTDESNPYTYVYKGVKIKFQIFEKTSCPPDWLVYNNYCYSMTTTKQKWDVSQKECNRRQSNLLSIKSEGEWKFLLSDLLKSSTDYILWTGLNDISNDKLQWLDNSSLSVFKGLNAPSTHRYSRCGAVYSSHGQLIMKDCNHLPLFAICKANKENGTRLYPVPLYNKNKASEKDELARSLKIGLIIFSLLLLVAIVVVDLCRRRIKGLCKDSGNERRRNANNQLQLDLDEPPSRGGRGEPDDAPPSYDQLFRDK